MFEGFPLFPEAASTIAPRVDALYLALVAFSAIFTLGIFLAIFYFAVRYDMAVGDDEERTLRAWHAADPPSDWERRRQGFVEGIQGNQNPFVRWPHLVDRIGDL